MKWHTVVLGFIKVLTFGILLTICLALLTSYKPAISAPAGNLKLIYQGGLKSFMPEDLGSDWGHNFSPSLVLGIDKQVFKLNYIADTNWQDSYDLTNPVNYNGGWALDRIQQQARDYPDNWWIIGEEVNFWRNDCPNKLFDGKICWFGDTHHIYPSPEVYAHWFHDVVLAIRAGWQEAGREGKIIGFYFVNDDIVSSKCGIATPTSLYLDRFKTEWDRLGWGEIPISGIDYNHRPACTNQPDLSGGGITQSTTYWTSKYQEMISRSWLSNKLLWGETEQGLLYTGDLQTARCDAAKRLVNLINWGKDTDWFDALLWFATIVDEDSQPVLKYSSLYVTHGIDGIGWNDQPIQGELTAVGKAFREGILPVECGGPTLTPTPTPANTPTPHPPTPTPPAHCQPLGDIDCSGKVNALDLSVLLAAFGKTGANLKEDLDDSGKVNALDLSILLSNFGKGT